MAFKLSPILGTSVNYLMIIHTGIFLMLDNWKEFKIGLPGTGTLGGFFVDNKDKLIEIKNFLALEYNYNLSDHQMGLLISGFLATIYHLQEPIKSNTKVDYVLVCDVSPGSELYYYTGYYIPVISNSLIPQNTNEYSKAMKIPYKEEAQEICNEINKQALTKTKEIKSYCTYHVEEHMYIKT